MSVSEPRWSLRSSRRPAPPACTRSRRTRISRSAPRCAPPSGEVIGGLQRRERDLRPDRLRRTRRAVQGALRGPPHFHACRRRRRHRRADAALRPLPAAALGILRRHPGRPGEPVDHLRHAPDARPAAAAVRWAALTRLTRILGLRPGSCRPESWVRSEVLGSVRGPGYGPVCRSESGRQSPVVGRQSSLEPCPWPAGVRWLPKSFLRARVIVRLGSQIFVWARTRNPYRSPWSGGPPSYLPAGKQG